MLGLMARFNLSSKICPWTQKCHSMHICFPEIWFYDDQIYMNSNYSNQKIKIREIYFDILKWIIDYSVFCNGME